MKKINFLLTLALTGLCISNASAGAWQHVGGAAGVQISTNAYINPTFTNYQFTFSSSDPTNGSYTSGTTFTFRFYPSAATPTETAPTSGAATHVFSLFGGPLTATAQGVARARVSAQLNPYSSTFSVNTADHTNDNTSPPAGSQTQSLSFNEGNQRKDVITDQDHPEGIEVTYLDISVSVSASSTAIADGRPGGTATANANGIGIRTDNILVP